MSEPLTGPGGPLRNQSLPDPRDELRAERDALAARLASVKALHQPRPFNVVSDGVTFGQSEYPDLCTGCRRTPWPCATAAALGSDAHTEQKDANPWAGQERP